MSKDGSLMPSHLTKSLLEWMFPLLSSSLQKRRLTTCLTSSVSLNVKSFVSPSRLLVRVVSHLNQGLLDISDELVFEECPVKLKTQKTLLVRNIGDAPAKFTIQTEHPFSVNPKNASVEPGKSIQLNVEFIAKHIGSFHSNMIIQYDTGESVSVKLMGIADNINIRLEKNHVKMDNTWNNMLNTKIVKLINRSDKMVKFAWKLYPNEIEEEHYRQQKLLELHTEETTEIEAFHSRKPQYDMMDLSIFKRLYKVSVLILEQGA
ncbi:hypothetical protein EDD86DRAFT_143580 [Gorgonomyces haynaldii]|nr:hypothetical protein EDD86DRAFT_143580 [Gorgonomyces haynaldii]